MQVIYMTPKEAKAVVEGLKKIKPEYAPYLRTVVYSKGVAVQWYSSGLYWPEVPDGNGLFDPNNFAVTPAQAT